MPIINDWVREALRLALIGIDFLAFEGQGLNEKIGHHKSLHRIEKCLENHSDTIDIANETRYDNFYQALGLIIRINNNDYVNAENRRLLKLIRDCLYEYLGETPPVNDPNQLEINFDGENQNRNSQ